MFEILLSYTLLRYRKMTGFLTTSPFRSATSQYGSQTRPRSSSGSCRPPTPTTTTAAAAAAAVTHTNPKQWHQLKPWVAFSNAATAFRDRDSHCVIADPASSRRVHVCIDPAAELPLPGEPQDKAALLCCLCK